MTDASPVTESTDLVFGQLPIAAVLLDSDGRITGCNARAQEVLGWGAAQRHRPLRELIASPVYDGDPLSQLVDGTAEAVTQAWVDLIRADAQRVTAHVTGGPVYRGSQRVGTTLVMDVPVSGSMQRDDGGFRSIIQQSSELVVVSDADGALRYVSPGMYRILGFQPGEVAGWNPLDFVHPDDLPTMVAAVASALGIPGHEGPAECRSRHRDGTWRWLEIIVTNLLDDPQVEGMVFTARDITARKELEQQLERQALHDPLTGLPNRALLHDRIVHALERLQREPDSNAAVLLLDLDDFKTINDTHGHEAGDRVLVAAGRRLRGVVRPHDTVGRLGGDEFVVVCQDLAEAGAKAVADRIAEAFQEPFHLGRHSLAVRPSVGWAVATAGDDPDEVLRRADVAMYQEKARARRAT